VLTNTSLETTLGQSKSALVGTHLSALDWSECGVEASSEEAEQADAKKSAKRIEAPWDLILGSEIDPEPTQMSVTNAYGESVRFAVNAVAIRSGDGVLKGSLTGVLNRRSLFEGMQALTREAGASKKPLSCIMTDIDHFKKVNDNYGHATGDEVIVLMAQILTDNMDPTALVGRYGGEEFVVARANHCPQGRRSGCQPVSGLLLITPG